MTKIYVTKYALTAGIQVRDAEISGTTAKVRGDYTDFFFGNDFHLTPESAVDRAEQMRVKRIKSLKKSIEKMEKLTFSIPETETP